MGLLQSRIEASYRKRCSPSEAVVIKVGPTAGSWYAVEPASHVAFVFERVPEDYDWSEPIEADSFVSAGHSAAEALANVLKLIEGRASEGLMGGRPLRDVFPPIKGFTSNRVGA